MTPLLFAQASQTTMTADQQTALGKAVLGFFLIAMVVSAILIISVWKLFKKAGRPGWQAFIPVYNLLVLYRIIGKPGWWTVLTYVPVVGIAMTVLLCLGLAKSFGKSQRYAVFMLLLPVAGFPMLAFGNAKYRPPQLAGDEAD